MEIKGYGKIRICIGKGSSGKCWATEKYAIKDFFNPKKNRKKILEEYTIGTLLHHENIIKTIDLVFDKNHIYEVFDLYKGDLFNLMKRGGNFNKNILFYELIKGVEYLHDRGICHRDLKLENCLIDFEGHLRIADFGCARVIKNCYTNRVTLCSERCGSEPYMAHEELCNDNDYNGFAVDIWAIGIIFVIMNTNNFPWYRARSEDKLYSEYLKTRRIRDIPLFVSCILDPDPAKRWKIENLIRQFKDKST
jgi:serine/threonine protein kinase